jgi:hypothetical protein
MEMSLPITTAMSVAAVKPILSYALQTCKQG